MGKRLYPVLKSDLDALAATFGLGPFPESTDPGTYGSAIAWSATRAWTVNELVLGAEGSYYLCQANAPAGTPVTDPRYFTPAPPPWSDYMGTVRSAARSALLTACGHDPQLFASPVYPASSQALFERAIVSGPWEIGVSSALPLCFPLIVSDANRTPSSEAIVYAYAYKDLEILADNTNVRMDIRSGFSGISIYSDGATGTCRVDASWTPNGHLKGKITIAFSTYQSVPDPSDPLHDAVTTSGVWEGDNLAFYVDNSSCGGWSSILCTVNQMGANAWQIYSATWGPQSDGDWDGVRWLGQTPALATNVISQADIYRAVPVSPMPKFQANVWEWTGTAASSYAYGGGANIQPMLLYPTEIVPGNGLGTYRLRAKTQPAWDLAWGSIPSLSTDPLWQRDWYPMGRQGSSVAAFTTQQARIREIDSLAAWRDGITDQTRPVVDRAATTATRPVLTATIGYLRTGETTLRVLGTVSVGAQQTRAENYLGRANALIVWDSLPLYWSGDGLLCSAGGPVVGAVNAPGASNDWSWGVPTLGFYTAAAAYYDDLVAIAAVLF